MRTFRLSIMCPAIMALAGGAALADSRAETTTYVDGNLTNVSPNSGGTLTSDDKAIHLRTGLENLDVPYTNVSHAELGAVIENSHDVPFYKIWAHKRSKTQTQYLIVNFKNDEGAEKTMTLELAQPAAAGILEAIEQGSGKTFEPATSTATAPVAELKPARKTQAPAQAKAEPKPAPPKPPSMDEIMKSGRNTSSEWWGDAMWKTTSNADKWNKPTGTIAPDQR